MILWMTESPAVESAKEPKYENKIVLANAADLIATILHTAEPADIALNREIASEFEAGGYEDRKKAIEAVTHFDVVSQWVRDNPDQAASIVLTCVYLRGGRFAAQEVVEVKEEEPEEIVLSGKSE